MLTKNIWNQMNTYFLQDRQFDVMNVKLFKIEIYNLNAKKLGMILAMRTIVISTKETLKVTKLS